LSKNGVFGIEKQSFFKNYSVSSIHVFL